MECFKDLKHVHSCLCLNYIAESFYFNSGQGNPSPETVFIWRNVYSHRKEAGPCTVDEPTLKWLYTSREREIQEMGMEKLPKLSWRWGHRSNLWLLCKYGKLMFTKYMAHSCNFWRHSPNSHIFYTAKLYITMNKMLMFWRLWKKNCLYMYISVIEKPLS